MFKKAKEDCDTCESLEVLKVAEKHAQKAWPMDPPPTSLQLGRGSWTLLHTMAAYYPENPSEDHQKHTLNFIKSLSHVYPCTHCAQDFQEYLIEHPPFVKNRQGLGQWMCEAHNHVNEQMGKPKFDCSKIDQRWKREKRTEI